MTYCHAEVRQAEVVQTVVGVRPNGIFQVLEWRAAPAVAPTRLTVNGSWVASCWLARPPMLNTFLEVFLSRSTLRPAFNRNAGPNPASPFSSPMA